MPGDDTLTPDQLAALYEHRHGNENPEFRDAVWRALCDKVFQRYIPTDSTVLDLGAGRGEFTRAVKARRRIAVDLNPILADFVGDAEALVTDATDLGAIPDESVDVVFSSNLLEHLPGTDQVVAALRESHRVLRPGGRIIVMMPNITYVKGQFWDYLDHVTPLNHRSLVEALIMGGFGVERVVPRFMPYAVNTKGVPQRGWIVRLYLSMPFVWPVFGKQVLAIGRR